MPSHHGRSFELTLSLACSPLVDLSNLAPCDSGRDSPHSKQSQLEDRGRGFKQGASLHVLLVMPCTESSSGKSRASQGYATGGSGRTEIRSVSTFLFLTALEHLLASDFKRSMRVGGVRAHELLEPQKQFPSLTWSLAARLWLCLVDLAFGGVDQGVGTELLVLLAACSSITSTEMV
jgi:hypothetical protein